MRRMVAAGPAWRGVWGLVVALLLAAAPVQAFEAFDGRLQAHGFYESQFRAINADFAEQWDVTQWYQVFNLELEFDLLQDRVGMVDLLSAYVRAEVRYDCIYSNGCGMFRGMNTFGDQSKSLPRRLQNATVQTSSGDIPIRNEGRASGATTDPVPLSEVPGFSGVADTKGQFITGSVVPCVPGDPNQSRPGLNCFPDGQDGTKPFDYVFERFSDFRFTMVNFKGGSSSGNPIAILGPWRPENTVSTNAVLADRTNPFDNSRLNPVLNCRLNNADPGGCASNRLEGGGARPFRPIPVYAEDYSRHGPEKITVVVYENDAVAAEANPNDPSTYRILKIDPRYNHGDERFTASGQRELYTTVNVVFPGDDPNDPNSSVRRAYDVRDLTRMTTGSNAQPLPNPNFRVVQSSDVNLSNLSTQPPQIIPGQSIAPRLEFVNGQIVTMNANTQARGLFVPSPPLRQLIQKGDLAPSWPLNLSESRRAWNRGLAQEDEKELKEAYFDIEMFDSQLWMRIGKQQIVWGKTELFRTTDQFNPQDLALATLPSLEESRIALWSARGVWSFYEVGPFVDVRLELAANIDDYQSSDFGSCGEPYAVDLVCQAAFGAFAHGFTGVGIVGVEKTPNPWQSLKGWEVGGRLEWRWERFSFALSDFWGYADLPSVRRVTTYERNVDTQTGRPLIYQGGVDPAIRRLNLAKSYAQDISTQPDMVTSLWQGIGNGDDPWEDPFGDLQALIVKQQENPGGVNAGTLPFARDPEYFVARTSRVNCGTTRTNSGPNANKIRYFPRPVADNNESGSLDPGPTCLTAGPTQLFDDPRPLDALAGFFPRNGDADRALGFDPNDPDCQLVDTNGDGQGDTVPSTCPYQPTNALDAHSANLTIFTWLCSATIGFLDLDKTACAQTVFGSTEEASSGILVAEAIGKLLAGDPLLNSALAQDSDTTCKTPQAPFCDGPGNKGSKFLPYELPIVLLSADPGDQESLGCQDFQTIDVPQSQGGQVACGGRADPITVLADTLSPEQEALLGCGPFWGTNCDQSGIDLLNMEPSTVLQTFAGAAGTETAVRLKQEGVRPPGTAKIDPRTGQPLPFRAPTEYRTDEGLQPGTLPWEVAGIGGPLCSAADIGGNYYPRGQDTIQVPGANGPVARPPSRKEALPGCHRKWVDKQNGYLNLAWGQPVFLQDGNGNLIPDPATGLPLEARNPSTNAVLIDYFYYSGNPDPLGVVEQAAARRLQFPDSVFTFSFPVLPNQHPLFADRPAIGPGHPFASQRAVTFANPANGPGNPQLIVPFASELAGLSWNFQMIAVAFSTEFQAALETVGDLADPNRPGCDPLSSNANLRTRCGATLEGGSIPTANPASAASQAANRRIVAQMLFGYCGSDYGVINPQTGLGTCRIDGNVNQLTALSQLYAANGINPLDPVATQQFQDTLQFPNVPLVVPEDPTDLSNQYDGPSPELPGQSPEHRPLQHHPQPALQLHHAAVLQHRSQPVLPGGLEAKHARGGRQRRLRSPHHAVALGRRGHALRPQAQRAGLRHGLRGGPQQVELQHRDHLDRERADRGRGSVRQHEEHRRVQPHGLHRPSHLRELHQPESHPLHQLPVVLPVSAGREEGLRGQRSLQRPGDAHGLHGLLPGPPESEHHVHPRHPVRLGRPAALDQLPLHGELLGDGGPGVLLRPRAAGGHRHERHRPAQQRAGRLGLPERRAERHLRRAQPGRGVPRLRYSF